LATELANQKGKDEKGSIIERTMVSVSGTTNRRERLSPRAWKKLITKRSGSNYWDVGISEKTWSTGRHPEAMSEKGV